VPFLADAVDPVAYTGKLRKGGVELDEPTEPLAKPLAERHLRSKATRGLPGH
jgi:hypothetical protein